MTYKEDENFTKLLNQIGELNINYNQDHLDCLYRDLKLYVNTTEKGYIDLTIPFFFSENYYVDLAIRELGGKTNKSIDSVDEYLSNDIATFVFENYFSESKENTLSKILSEISRITKNNIDYKIISESTYDEDKNQTSVTLEFSVNDSIYKITHDDDFEDGTLKSSFILKELLPKLNGALIKGHLLYICEEWIQFIYFENEKDYLKFKESANYYSEIELKKDNINSEIKSIEKEIIIESNENKLESKTPWWKRLWK